MADIVLHPATARALDQFVSRSFHAGLLVGPAGSGKAVLSRTLAARLAGLDDAAFAKHPYVRIIAPIDNKAIPIESIRELQHFMTLKIPGSADTGVARIAIIEDAHLLTVEAQNALLKTLEEPPADTALLLTSSSPEALLPTIRSRTQTVQVVPPALDDVKRYFTATYAEADVDRALMLSGGLPGLTDALLADSESHPLFEATVQARGLLQASAYERLAQVDSLSKQKQLSLDTLFILGQMARMALMRQPNSASAAAKRWQSILKASYTASDQLRRNAQAKLVLTNLMLAV